MPTRAQLRDLGLTREEYDRVIQEESNDSNENADTYQPDDELSEVVNRMLQEDSSRRRPRPIQQIDIGEDFTPYYNYQRYNKLYNLYRKRFYKKQDETRRHRLPDQFPKTEQVQSYTRRSAKDPETDDEDDDYYDNWRNHKKRN